MVRQSLRRLAYGALIAVSLAAAPASAQTSFYIPQPGEMEGLPGSVIRHEPVSGAPLGAVATRILYRTTAPNNAPTAGSGIVIAPAGPPLGERPIIVWAHPTTGVEPPCAPSLASTFFEKVQGIVPMLERGYVVVAPDYPGLGTAGPHAYLVGEAAARAVLDAVRAVKSLQVGAGNRFAVWGHSQGGHASIFTGLFANRYAPELQLVGVAAAAPATDLGTLLRDDYATPVGKMLTAMAIRSWAQVFGAPIGQIVAGEEIATVNRLGGECLESRLEIYEAAITEIPLRRKFLVVPDMTKVEPWRDIIVRNTPGPLPPDMPLLMIQGTADTVVEPAVTDAYVRKQCATGSPVRFIQMPGIGHNPIARDTAPAAVQWMADRFAGLPPPTDCAAR